MNQQNNGNGVPSTGVSVITHTIMDKKSGTTVATTTTLPPEVMNQEFDVRSRAASDLIIKSDDNLKHLQSDLRPIMGGLLGGSDKSYLTKDGNTYLFFHSNIYGSPIGGDIHQQQMTFINEWNQIKNTIDMERLANEFDSLIEAMKQRATEDNHYRQTGETVLARDELKKADGAAMLKHLKKGGEFALGVAKEVGVSLLVGILERMMKGPTV